MEQLDRLWEYQELDILFDQYVQEKRNSASRQRLLKLRNYLIDQEKNLVSLDDEAEKKNNAFNKVEHECEGILSAITTDKSKLESGDIASLKEIEAMMREGLQLKDRLYKKEKDLQRLINDLDKFQKNLDDIRIQVSKAKKEYTQVKKKYDSEAAEIKQKQLKVKKQIKEIAKDIDKSLIQKYTNIKTGRTPVIAKLTDNQCSGCYMSLASLVVQRVKDQENIVQCENCGRMIYYRE